MSFKEGLIIPSICDFDTSVEELKALTPNLNHKSECYMPLRRIKNG